jgi:hypothetical protein
MLVGERTVPGGRDGVLAPNGENGSNANTSFASRWCVTTVPYENRSLSDAPSN